MPTEQLIAGRSFFVGRKRETEQLRSALDDALAGRGRLVTLAGEPGIGKTRLTEELTQEAASRQVRVLWGRCWEGGGAPAFWPWIQVLREAIRGCESSALVAAGSWLQYIARMLPELQSSLPEGAFRAGSIPAMLSVPGEQNEADPARFHLFDCITNFLRLIAAKPLMLALDDIHAADADSLLLLSFFARHLRDTRIIVVTTYREVEAEQSRYEALLKETEREGICIPLRGLAESEVAEFVQCNIGLPAEQGLVSSLHQATGGNPFFLDETVRLMIADRTSPREHLSNQGFAIPHGVRAATRRRLAPIAEASRRVLTIASVIGYEFDLDLLAGLSQLTREQVTEALSQAVSLRVIRELPGTYGRYRFNHGIIAEVLRGDVGRTELIRLHRRVAETLEDLHAKDLSPYFARLAHHYMEALPDGPVDKAVNYARLGAESARTRLAYAEAARLYNSALLALDATRRPDEALRCEVLLGLGEAESKAGTREQAYRAFRRAADIARGLGRTDLLARAALAPGMWSVTPGTVDAESIALIEEAIGRVGADDSALRALLLARLATELYWTERREAALPMVREAIEVARRIGDRSALVSTLWTQYRALWGPDGAERRLEAAIEMVALAQDAGDQDWLLKAHELKIAALVELGDVQKADYEIAAYEKLEKDSGQASGAVERFRAMRALARGEFQEAERLSRMMLAIAERRQEQTAIMSASGQLTWLSYERGAVADWIPVLKAQATQFPALAIARCALALFYLQSGDLAGARSEFEYFAVHDFTAIPRDWNWMGAITALATVCAGLSDARRAAVLYQLLLPYADRNIMMGWADMCYGSASHHLGLLAMTLGQLDDSQAHFETALEFDLKMGARAALPYTQVSYAAMLLARGRAGDTERALEMAKSGRALADQLGMHWLANQAGELEARAQASEQPPPAPSNDKPGSANEFKRDGEVWTITWAGKTVKLKNANGLHYIAHLLRFPGREFHVLDMVAPGTADVEQRGTSDEALRAAPPGDAGEMLDAQAKAMYKSRITELRQEIEEAREFNDEERAHRAEEELDALARELSRAVGLSGRDRRAASVAERVRLNVTRAIKRAIERIAEHHSELGAMLEKTIKTGIFCSYIPRHSDADVPWDL